MAPKPDHFAIVIGIADADAPAPGSAARNAQAFAEWLLSSGGGGLPPSNVVTILSSPQPATEPAAVPSRQWEIDRALLNFGAASGELLGQRLYFYFSGRASGAPADLALRMAEDSPLAANGSLSLAHYRAFLRGSGLFEEVVYVLDCSHTPERVAAAASPSLVPVETSAAVEVAELLLLALAGGRAAARGPGAEEPIGVLTRAVLEGLGEQPVTSSSLAESVRRRVPELAGAGGAAPALVVEQAGREIALTGAVDEQRPQGLLVVEVPHWAAQVRLYDDLLRPRAEAGPVTEAPDGYRSETALPPGIYQVEVSLGGKTEQQLVLVRAGSPARVEVGAWKGLKGSSAALLAGAAKLQGEQTLRAEEWSRRRTWQEPDQAIGDSGLFLFVSSLEGRPDRGFGEGLTLLNVTGKKVVSLAGEAVETQDGAGWMAFSTDLAAGYYVLRRQRRRGLPIYHQPIALCAGWQTQVFVPARRSPLLRELTLNMAPLRQGFQPDEDTAVAVALVLDRLQHGTSGARIVLTEHVHRLLEGERRNPWLGVLAAYALLRSREAGFEDLSEWSTAGLFQRVLAFLQSTLGDHPDVAALSLADDSPATGSIPHPPLLRYGLQRVQRHATRFAGTIAADSLTDCVMDALEPGTPWTAWRGLVRLSAFGDPARSGPESDANAGGEMAVRRRSLGGRRPRPEPTSPAGDDPISFAQAAPPSAPIFRLAVPDQGATAGAPAESATAAALSEAPLIGLARDLVHGGGLEELPDAVLDPGPSLSLRLEQLSSREVSAASGLPLDRTQRALDLLRQSAPDQDAAGPAPGGVSDAATEATIASIALEVARQVLKSPEPAAPAPAAGGPVAVSVPGAPAPVSTTIEECVARLQAEARRILPPPPAEQSDRTEALSGRLLDLADELFSRADFVVITDAGGRLERGNGAFQALLGTAEKGTAEEKAAVAARGQAWQEVFQGAPLGHSALANPAPFPQTAFSRRADPQHWELRRTAVEAAAGGDVKAYMNFLRIAGAPRIDASLLVRVDWLLSRVTMFASLYALGSVERREEYAEELAALIEQLDAAVQGDATPAAVPATP